MIDWGGGLGEFAAIAVARNLTMGASLLCS